MILLVGAGQKMTECFVFDYGLHISKASIYDNQANAIEALKGQHHFDVIITSYGGQDTDERGRLRSVRSLDHCKDTSVAI